MSLNLAARKWSKPWIPRCVEAVLCAVPLFVHPCSRVRNSDEVRDMRSLHSTGSRRSAQSPLNYHHLTLSPKKMPIDLRKALKTDDPKWDKLKQGYKKVETGAWNALTPVGN